MKIAIRVQPRIRAAAEGDDGVPRFRPLPESRGVFPLAFTLSVALHLAGGAVAPPLFDFLTEWSRPMVELRTARMLPRDALPLLVRMPKEPLVLRLPKLPARIAPKLRNIRTRPERAARAPEAARAFALKPAPRQAPVATAVLLQPELKAAPVPEIPDLRTLAVWTGRSAAASSQPVVVGAAEPVAQARPPAVITPPVAPTPSPVRTPTPALPAEAGAQRPKLVLPASGSSPLQVEFARLEEPSIPAGSHLAGEAAAIIALSTMTARPGELVAVPPGSVVILGNGGGAGAPKPPPAQSAMPSPPEPPRAAPPAERAAATVAQRAPEPPASGNGAARTEQATAPAATRSIRAMGGEIQLQTAADGTVSLTYPSNGSFDVVVVESALPEAVAQFGQSLSGRPVHTAYINVGAAAEWVLQYCLPQGQAGGAQQGMVVTLDAPAPLKAPYLLRATLPAEAGWRSAGYQVFHGLLNAAGRVEQLRAVRSGAASAALLSALSTWVFRPATSAGSPKLVEFLLVIPPRGGA